METKIKFAHLFDRQICEDYDARNIRNAILKETDKYLISDYPITAEYRKQIIEHRQFLRDIPNQTDFPIGADWGNFPEETMAQGDEK